MSNISFNNAPGNLFNRLGSIGYLVAQADSYQTQQVANITNTVNGVVSQFVTESDIQGIAGTNYIGAVNSAGDGMGGLAQNLAEQTVNRVVFRAMPQLGQTLTTLNTLASLQEIILQMRQQGATILAMTITASIQALSSPGPNFTGTGNGIMVVSTKRPLDGLVLENTFAETITVFCSADSYVGGAVAGNETMTIQGQGAETDYFAFDWPLGSNAYTACSAIDGNQNGGVSGNLLTNSNFATWSGGSPNNWTVNGGSSIISNNTTQQYDGSGCMLITGNGASNINLTQQFNNSNGTVGQLTSLTQDSVNVFLKRGGLATTGIMVIDLVDQNGTVILDQNGVANSLTIDLSTLATTYTAFNTPFRIPLVLPTSQYLRVRTTTPVNSGGQVYFSKASLGLMTQTYTSGPYISVHAGSTPFAQGDYGYINTTNSRGAGGTRNTFQTLLARLLPTQVLGNELLFPSSSNPSISDSLII